MRKDNPALAAAVVVTAMTKVLIQQQTNQVLFLLNIRAVILEIEEVQQNDPGPRQHDGTKYP